MAARLTLIFAMALLAAAMPSAANACLVGGTQLLFSEEPAEAPKDVGVIKVHFTNIGQEVDAWRDRNPRASAFQILIGVARETGGDADTEGSFPVYAVVTSCTHQFWSMAFPEQEPDPVFDGQYWLVGRFVSDKNGQRFVAVGNHNGRWPE